jgi:hypothetical protein
MSKAACWLGLACVAWAVAAAAQDTAPAATYLEEAKITVDERARSDGFLRVRVQPQNGEAREGTVAIARRMSENDIAKGLAAALSQQLGPAFKVDRDAGEHVKIRKANKDDPNFSVELTFNVTGFSIILDEK